MTKLPRTKLLIKKLLRTNLFREKNFIWLIAALALTLIVGCSSTDKTNDPADDPQLPSSQTEQGAETNPPSQPSEISQTPDKEKNLLLNLRELAEQGKVINCDYPVKATIFENVTAQWGDPDKRDWVAAAKGEYATFSSRDVVFGINKGSQIFEVRSFSAQIKQITLAKTKEFFGAPPYDVKVNGEQIIGYTAGQEFKIEFVFPESTSSSPDPKLDHYLVLYPRGTVNMMADDPGRQW